MAQLREIFHYVYLIHEEGATSPVKIGITQAVNKRISNLGSGNPRPLVLFRKWAFRNRNEAADVEESMLSIYHAKGLHLRGEWLSEDAANIAAEIDVFIKDLNDWIQSQRPDREAV